MNGVAHFDLSAKDREKLASFYAELFGWHTQSIPEMSYVTVDPHSGKGLMGGIGPAGDGPPSTTLYVEVPDIQASLDKAADLGGKTHIEANEVPGVVALAVTSDPQGNALGLLKNISVD